MNKLSILMQTIAGIQKAGCMQLIKRGCEFFLIIKTKNTNR